MAVKLHDPHIMLVRSWESQEQGQVLARGAAVKLLSTITVPT